MKHYSFFHRGNPFFKRKKGSLFSLFSWGKPFFQEKLGFSPYPFSKKAFSFLFRGEPFFSGEKKGFTWLQIFVGIWFLTEGNPFG